jgi:hypothetical protein
MNKFEIINENEDSVVHLPNNEKESSSHSFMIQEEKDPAPQTKNDTTSASVVSDHESQYSEEELQPTQAKQSSNAVPTFKPKPNLKNFDHFNPYMNPSKKKPVRDTRSYDDNETHASEESEVSDDVSESSSDRKSGSSDDDTQFSRRKRRRSKNSSKEYFQKQKLLQELEDLKQRGYIVHQKYSIQSKLEDLNNEVELGNNSLDLQSNQLLAENIFFWLIRGIEMSTLKFNPLGLQLNGLYDSTIQHKNIIKHNIRAILKKHTGPEGSPWSPEFMLCGVICFSIVTTHFANTFMKDNPMIGNAVNAMGTAMNAMNENPNFMDNIMKTMSGLFQTSNNAPQPSNSNQYKSNATPQTSPDINDYISRFFPQQPPSNLNVTPQNNFMQPPQQTRIPTTTTQSNTNKNESDRFSVMSSDSDVSDIDLTKARQQKRIKRKNKTLYID